MQLQLKWASAPAAKDWLKIVKAGEDSLLVNVFEQDATSATKYYSKTKTVSTQKHSDHRQLRRTLWRHINSCSPQIAWKSSKRRNKHQQFIHHLNVEFKELPAPIAGSLNLQLVSFRLWIKLGSILTQPRKPAPCFLWTFFWFHTLIVRQSFLPRYLVNQKKTV